MGWKSKPVQLKLTWALPTGQLAVAIFLLEWGNRSHGQKRFDTLYSATPTLICGGINAPARVLAAMASFFDRIDRPEPEIFGLPIDYIFFLTGIVILWMLVGWSLDRKRFSSTGRSAWSPLQRVLVGVPLVMVGILLFYQGVHGLLTPGRFNNYAGNVAQSLLFLLWSVVLIALPSVAFVKHQISRRNS